MRVLGKAIFIQANKNNFNPNVRALSSVRYIVMHYTSNTNDTAKNNALYFRDAIVKASAHYFVSDNTIYQSVPDDHAAYSVGLGSMKEPYFKWPTMWQKITNGNSISIELCGSKSGPEASEETKITAAQLAADLMDKYGLTLDALYRHYDVTGKQCPKWAVDDPLKWAEMRILVSNYFYPNIEEKQVEEEADEMKDTPENYSMFKTFMKRYEEEKAEQPPTWEAGVMASVAIKGIMDGTRPKSNVTRGELAQVVERLT